MKEDLAKRSNVGYNKRMKKKLCVDSIVSAEFRMRIYTIKLDNIIDSSINGINTNALAACRSPKVEEEQKYTNKKYKIYSIS